jgi:hypothetical protein
LLFDILSILKDNNFEVVMTKEKLRLESFRFLSRDNEKIRTKFNNICGKTGQYFVPDELFQKRTSRSNRVLIPWKSVKSNNLTLEQLETFKGGVVVEFINEDFFSLENMSNATFVQLKQLLGSNEIVSSIISFRSESGTSSSEIQRRYFDIFTSNYELVFNGNTIVINKRNIEDYVIHKTMDGGTGNEKWSGFVFYSIKGGQQDLIQSHLSNETLFNPAPEYADNETKLDIDLTMAFFAMHSIDYDNLNTDEKGDYSRLMKYFKIHLSESRYDYEKFTGSLLDYCENHPSLKLFKGSLYDPIQVEKINLEDFGIDNKEDSRNLDFTHNEAVIHDRYYFDRVKRIILTPARPTNIFWSKHLSNMMQQNFSLNEFFRHEEEIVMRRNQLLNHEL